MQNHVELMSGVMDYSLPAVVRRIKCNRACCLFQVVSNFS